ncbi:hypothetical protein [Flavobacterium aquatile]|uniref:Uncharacterized protein n=1 Tax=Flavobacterium aquatile LMG 4008 = ATCC 11947 TaxID=1453498 RepID=A0A095SXP1_9FLAO|nr:hypothetical protein [Flavobacterium aquatile]KGD69342.1 hypothetical protein LG45_00770 [Flavobacterium aquatile LMG 4008 = ATCC 11947]OXA66202.1 hypothetical protein B0A61_13110 [Flavobacterium aquatile LMG 4008 = ATCC 11947]GEC77693.1 hypothetical protein FAQ01_05630 [Flavobacterium aquatile]
MKIETSLIKEKTRITNDKKLDKELKSFVLFLNSIHKLEFETSDYPNSSYLLKERIIYLHNTSSYRIENFTLLALKLYENYKQILKFRQSKNLQKDIEFLDQIEKKFTQEHFIHHYHSLEKELWKIIVFENNNKYQSDFHEFLKTLLENKHEKTFLLVEAYSQLLPVLQISNQAIYDNSLILLDITKSDAEWNIPRGEVLIGLRSWAFQYTSRGKELLNLSLLKSDDNVDIISALIAGIYDKLGLKFYTEDIENFVNSKSSLFGIFNGLAIIKDIGEKEASLYIKLFDLHSSDENLLIPLVRMLLAVIKSKSNFKNKIKSTKQIFFRLNEVFKRDNQGVIRYVLNEISFLDNYYSEKTDLLLNLISQNHFSNDKYINGICQVFWHLKEIDSLKKVLLALAAFRPFKNTAKYFTSSFHHFDPLELDKMIIEFLLDNKAYIRHLGISVFDRLSPDSGYLFKNNILKLEPLEQYKLWVAVCRNLKEPKHFLPCLLPLLKSNSETVKESFICKLEEFSEDYGGHITQLLEEKIGIYVSQQIFERIKNYSDNFNATNLDVKNKILELNPYYTHNKLFIEFNAMYRRDFSKKINKGGQENSFLSQLATTVQLGKGGGWRIGEREEISKLGSFGVSFALPRSYFIFPDKYDMEMGVEMREDWQEGDFDLIKEFISNEQQ